MRGLGVSEQIQAVLDMDPTPSPTRAPSVVPPLFSSHHSSFQPDSGIDVTTSGASIPTEGSYPAESGLLNFTSLNSLPGSSYFQLGSSSSKASYHSLLKRQSLQGKYSYPASARSPSATYVRPVCAQGNRYVCNWCIDVNNYITLLICLLCLDSTTLD